jgi:S-adenosylmethionine-diacylgycerolhomoserine-N-methlytransferase
MSSDSSPTLPVDGAPAGHVQLMDQMYRMQRYFYDATRKYYLFGRDRLIARMSVLPGQHVIEIGCGTGRNLILLARQHRDACFYGVDAANVMIDTAQSKVTRQQLNVQLRQGLAEELNADAWFHIPAFDRVFFSYSLSMIPTWPAAIEAALVNLKPGGEMWVVDFWDQAGYPWPIPSLLRSWLAMFHVHHRPELLEYLQKLQADGRGTLNLEPVGNRYAYLARFVKNT